MKVAVLRRRRHASRGAALVEFAMVAVLLIVVLLSVVEMSRMLLAFTSVTNAARAATRYAIVHGSGRTGSGIDGPSGPTDYTQVVEVAKTFMPVFHDTRVTVTVTYFGGNDVGDGVQVAVSYAYDPLVGILPTAVSLSNTSRGVIVF